MTGNKRQVHVSSFCFVPCWLYFDFSFFLSEQFRSKFMMYISKEHFSPCKIQVREKRKLFLTIPFCPPINSLELPPT